MIERVTPVPDMTDQHVQYLGASADQNPKVEVSDAPVERPPSPRLRSGARQSNGDGPARDFRLAPDAAIHRLEFWSRVRKGEGCWEWTGPRDLDGYGCFFIEKQNFRAHRISLLLTANQWPEEVCHRCDNPPCVRPDHLFAGNRLINARDAIAKGRHISCRKGRRHK